MSQPTFCGPECRLRDPNHIWGPKPVGDPHGDCVEVSRIPLSQIPPSAPRLSAFEQNYQVPQAGARVDRMENRSDDITDAEVARMVDYRSDSADFEKPGAVARDPLTEAWHPSDVPSNIRHVLIALGVVALLGFTFLAGMLVGAGGALR